MEIERVALIVFSFVFVVWVLYGLIVEHKAKRWNSQSESRRNTAEKGRMR